AGRVKTRLVPPLSAQQASSLHQAFVTDLVIHLQQNPACVLELHTDTSTDAWKHLRVTQRLQSEGGLELKLFKALQNALASGHGQAAVLGTDAPSLPLDHISALLSEPADVTLGPSDDGGFWGIAARTVRAGMFARVRWSQSDTLEQTRTAIQAAGLSCALGPRWFDVDEPPDLYRLFRGDLPPHTARWLCDNRAAIEASRAG
ncbi:MAG TPA: TIGR04282 family arsenosugar biosynthesis glycosyltransferase, partial [Bryobacteraceae bacterium]|nr:TIGR04282 family arsenosugar biosynthesis glycosyltransferase [Bryobacteraceae bacterium]